MKIFRSFFSSLFLVKRWVDFDDSRRKTASAASAASAVSTASAASVGSAASAASARRQSLPLRQQSVFRPRLLLGWRRLAAPWCLCERGSAGLSAATCALLLCISLQLPQTCDSSSAK